MRKDTKTIFNAKTPANSGKLSILARNSLCWKDRDFALSVLWGFIFLFVALVLNYAAGIYATERASNPVTDIILSNIPTFDVDGLFVYGTVVFWGFIIFLCVAEPQRTPFIVKSTALFVCIRSLFISLTHIGPFPTQITVDSNILAAFSFGGDLFFSGHVGLPFLMALAFWKDTLLRNIFVYAALFFGVVVLLAHLHYSIDVLSAFFITYTIYCIAEVIFKKDRQFFDAVIH